MTRLNRCGIIVALAVLVLPAMLPAEGPPPSAVARESTPQKIIILNNGRVISGNIQDRPGGYLVDNTIGQIVIPHTHVRLTAADLPDAYQKLKDSITQPSAGAHVALGQWCFDNRLYDSAREQVKAALILEPQRKEARTLLKNIERLTIGDNFAATIPAAVDRSNDGFEKSAAVSLDGLSTSVTQDFVRRVQPLLMNKCGNAQCHGTAGTSEFRLAPVRLGMSGYRSLTDQNLASVLRYLDVRQPRASALLVTPTGTHGDKGPIWNGPRADEQLAELRAWVTRVAVEKAPLTTTAAVEQVSAVDSPAQPEQDPLLQQVLAEERPDAFDPALFNQRVHGRE